MSIFNTTRKPSRDQLIELITRQQEQITKLMTENLAHTKELDRLKPQRDHLAVTAKLNELTGRLDALLADGRNL